MYFSSPRRFTAPPLDLLPRLRSLTSRALNHVNAPTHGWMLKLSSNVAFPFSAIRPLGSVIWYFGLWPPSRSSPGTCFCLSLSSSLLLEEERFFDFDEDLAGLEVG